MKRIQRIEAARQRFEKTFNKATKFDHVVANSRVRTDLSFFYLDIDGARTWEIAEEHYYTHNTFYLFGKEWEPMEVCVYLYTGPDVIRGVFTTIGITRDQCRQALLVAKAKKLLFDLRNCLGVKI